MVVSHYPVSEEIQRSVDYYVFDANNPVTEHSFYNKFYNYRYLDVEININGLKILINLSLYSTKFKRI
jgi:hypothetical protein